MMIFGQVTKSRIAYRKKGKENVYPRGRRRSWAPDIGQSCRDISAVDLLFVRVCLSCLHKMSDRALDPGAGLFTWALNSFCQSSDSPPCGFLNGVMKWMNSWWGCLR